MNPTPNNAPRWLKRLVDSRHFGAVFLFVGVALAIIPGYIWGLAAGFLWIGGIILGFSVGYWLARAEWRSRGFVPSLTRLDELNREPTDPPR